MAQSNNQSALHPFWFKWPLGAAASYTFFRLSHITKCIWVSFYGLTGQMFCVFKPRLYHLFLVCTHLLSKRNFAIWTLSLQYRYAEISYGLIAVLCIQAQEGKTRSIFSMFPGNKPLLVSECLLKVFWYCRVSKPTHCPFLNKLLLTSTLTNFDCFMMWQTLLIGIVVMSQRHWNPLLCLTQNCSTCLQLKCVYYAFYFQMPPFVDMVSFGQRL